MNLMTWLFGKIEIACEHKWKIIAATFQPPALSIEFKGIINYKEIDKLRCGTTLLNSVCEKCGYTSQEERLGRFTPPGFEWKDNK